MKLQPTDLQIGDWVLIEDTPEQITGVDEKYVHLEGNACERFHEWLIEPIPLTPEILEKIGFVSQRNVGYILDDYDGTQVIYDRWNSNLRIIKDYKVRLDIDFYGDMSVHELQHVLRLLEIEKENEL